GSNYTITARGHLGELAVNVVRVALSLQTFFNLIRAFVRLASSLNSTLYTGGQLFLFTLPSVVY
ncbi:hypothetical protein, partial [Pantoea sp. GbtcB22]|uniref:hypothetical protein n=1 Tax=Pantoea sp. GbtcB22 TaxID=2824767 RepID=UPI001C30A13E